MKKFLGLLLIGLIFCMPIVAMADPLLSAHIPDEPTDKEEIGDDMIRQIHPITIVKEGDVNDSEMVSFQINFTFGSAIKDADCTGESGYEATYKSAGSNKAVCTFEAETGSTEDEILIGYIQIDVDKNAKDEDCAIEYEFKEAKAEFNNPNPETGASLPLQIVLGGFVLAAGTYAVSKRRNKLYSL